MELKTVKPLMPRDGKAYAEVNGKVFVREKDYVATIIPPDPKFLGDSLGRHMMRRYREEFKIDVVELCYKHHGIKPRGNYLCEAELDLFQEYADTNAEELTREFLSLMHKRKTEEPKATAKSAPASDWKNIGFFVLPNGKQRYQAQHKDVLYVRLEEMRAEGAIRKIPTSLFVKSFEHLCLMRYGRNMPGWYVIKSSAYLAEKFFASKDLIRKAKRDKDVYIPVEPIGPREKPAERTTAPPPPKDAPFSRGEALLKGLQDRLNSFEVKLDSMDDTVKDNKRLSANNIEKSHADFQSVSAGIERQANRIDALETLLLTILDKLKGFERAEEHENIHVTDEHGVRNIFKRAFGIGS